MGFYGKNVEYTKMIENQQTSVGGMEYLVGGMENYYVMVFNNKRLL